MKIPNHIFLSLQVMYIYYFLAHKLLSMGGGKERIKTVADNTFILALDGDVDFQPSALRLLIDRMKRNPNVGAACGRIHPIGSGTISFVLFGLNAILKMDFRSISIIYVFICTS